MALFEHLQLYAWLLNRKIQACPEDHIEHYLENIFLSIKE